MTPPSPPSPEAMVATVRRLEARVAQLEDSIQVYGVGRKRWPIPELTSEQRKTLYLVLAFAMIAAYQASRSKGV